MKTCPQCGTTKALEAYHRDRRKHDGRQGYCAACRRERYRAYYAARKCTRHTRNTEETR